MVWSEVALLGVGAALGQAAAIIQRRGDRKSRRQDSTEEQTRASLLVIAARLQDLSMAAERRDDDLGAQVQQTVDVLRRQALLVAHAELRARIGLAKDCLEWNTTITGSYLGAGIVYLTRYIVGDLEPAIGAYLRHEAIPPRTARLDDCEAVLHEEWATGEHC
jgi:hypothetical protein